MNEKGSAFNLYDECEYSKTCPDYYVWTVEV